VSRVSRAGVLAAYRDGLTVICELAAQFTGATWLTVTPCSEWRAVDLSGHLRCVADDYHEYLDDAPASRLARLLATDVPADSLARKLARQNAAELAALPDAPGPDHIAAFAESARAYGRRLAPSWDLPHHRYRGAEITVGAMAGAACAEWHLHAWDLARSLGKDYRPADPELVLAGWRGGTPQLWPAPAAEPGSDDPWYSLLLGSGRDPGWAQLLQWPAVAGLGRGPLNRLRFVTLDVSRVRAAYPALNDGYAYLDGAAGTQVPAAVVEAIAATYRSGIGNAGGAFPASARADAIVAECRRALADLTGAEPDGVILGPNMTTLTYRLAETLSRQWGPGDEVVVSRLDHDANVRPWVQAAARSGATLRWAEVDPSTAELPAAQYGDLLGEHTRLVAVTAASNIVGTRPDVPAIAAAAHAVGALCYVDGVHATPHVPVDVRALGADFYATSAYKWSGPHIGTVVADPALLETLHPDKLEPAPAGVPGRFERGTAAFADLAGVAAAVDHLAALDHAATGSRRDRVLASMAAVEQYEGALFTRLLDGLAAMRHVTLYGKAALRTPTAFFTVAGYTPRAVAAALADAKVNVWNGDNYAWELARVLGVREAGGGVRAGLVHYNDEAEVDRLLAAVAELAPGSMR
jgi:cysteine desulfurase family protein (TIGR01976 family)